MKTLVVIGASGGIGYECVKEILLHDENRWKIILGQRDHCSTKAIGALEDYRKIAPSDTLLAPFTCDLASFSSIRSFVANLKEVRTINSLIFNAGCVMDSVPTYTEDGLETTYQVNHVGYWLLLKLLLDAGKTIDRIVFVNSALHRKGRDLSADECLISNQRQQNYAYDGVKVYGNAKLVQVLCVKTFVNALERSRESGQVPEILICSPGFIPQSDLGGRLVALCATSPEYSGKLGLFIDKDRKESSLNPLAQDQALQKKWWLLTCKAAGIDPFI
ncbi:WW domain-containing oxidoreductase [Neolecta irregularis DAH-3]|uniref:WW domain-containing oxidoreductase n=1 Tax=Neolecta irregularis (strain DAH-3) TaxID=1198029 RepID=A0A1U7LVM8_NEOID|nr:WW domain-containing oxidoreductase [Neolecta irregularis DAH-3]|eukprot:OLL26678.1 WW domain-containing oxidoreductase [Neolecta irregularis DAH-3]